MQRQEVELELEARLDGTVPTVKRRLLAPGRYTLGQLHHVLRIAFGWNGRGKHSFTIGSRTYVDDEEYDALDLHDYEAEQPYFAAHYEPMIDEASVRLVDVLRPRVRASYHYELYLDVHVQLEVVEARAADRGCPATCLEGTPRLENYRLAKLSLADQMKVALLEGPMTLADLGTRLEAAGVALPHGAESLKKAWKRRPPIRERVDGLLELDPDHAEYERLVRSLRDLLVKADPAAGLPASLETPAPRDREQTRAWFSQLDKGVVRASFHRNEVAACVLLFPSGEVRHFPPEGKAALRQTCEWLGLVVGLEPRALFERLGAETEGRTLLDVAPPFSLAGTSVEAVVSLNVAGATLTSAADLDELWRHGGREDVMACLESDVRALYAYYRVAVLRWGVLRSSDELHPVEWNLGAEPMLSDLLEAAIDERQAVELAVVGRTGAVERRRFRPEGWDGPPLVHRTYCGRWEDGSAAQLRFVDILDIGGGTPA